MHLNLAVAQFLLGRIPALDALVVTFSPWFQGLVDSPYSSPPAQALLETGYVHHGSRVTYLIGLLTMVGGNPCSLRGPRVASTRSAQFLGEVDRPSAVRSKQFPAVSVAFPPKVTYWCPIPLQSW